MLPVRELWSNSFKWSVDPASAYSVVPASGSVPPNGTLNAVVTFRPVANALTATRMGLVVEGGDDVVGPPTLSCDSTVDEPKLVFSAKKVWASYG